VAGIDHGIDSQIRNLAECQSFGVEKDGAVEDQTPQLEQGVK